MKHIRFSGLALLCCMTLAGCLKKDIDYAHGTPSPVASIEVLRNIYRGNEIKLTTDHLMGAERITGVVISDTSGHNLPAGNFIIQDIGRGNLRGIAVSLGGNAPVNYSAGDSVAVNVIGATLLSNNGALQLSNVGADKVSLLRKQAKVTVKSISLSELATNFAIYEATLVKVNADFKIFLVPEKLMRVASRCTMDWTLLLCSTPLPAPLLRPTGFLPAPPLPVFRYMPALSNS